MSVAEIELKSWTAARIGELTQTRESDCLEIAECILGFDDPAVLKDWLKDFTEKSAEHKVGSFVEALFERKERLQEGAAPAPPAAAPAVAAAPATREEDRRDKGDKGKGKSKNKGREDRSKGKGEPKRELPTMDMPYLPRQEGDKRLMVVDASSGRHKVLTNCLNCGKVIVEQEGWGPCLFCGNPLEVGDQRNGVKRGDERGRIESHGTSVEEEEKFNASFQRAVATKDRLLTYDRDAKRRTKVYDDATDWFTESQNPWLSEKQREDARAKGQDEERRRREERRKIHAKIDLFGRTVIDTGAEVEEEMKKKDREMFHDWQEGTTKNERLLKMLEEQRGLGAKAQLSDESQKLYERLRAALHATNKDKSLDSLKGAKQDQVGERKTRSWNVSAGERVEDEFSAVSMRDFQVPDRPLLPVEESPYADSEDTGQCLSMHQPWASLLVYGFKRAEGRSWKSDHRGRLWIHATAKAPDPAEIQALEERYSFIYEAAGVPIPSLPSKSGGYPTSALLGCVDVEACWSKSEYASVLEKNPSMPQEESESDFIFWCLRPRRLLVPLKMAGDHKIWRLEKSSLQPAQRGLQPVRWPRPQEGEKSMTSPAIEKSQAKEKPATAAAQRSAEAIEAQPNRTQVHLDLWPSEASERLELLDSSEKSAVVLQNGFVQLSGHLPWDLQQRIVDEMREIGIQSHGFSPEDFDGVKMSEGVHRMYLGLRWNSVARTWESSRVNHFVAALPKFLAEMYSDAVKSANREMQSAQNKRRKLQPFPEKAPTVAAVEFCPMASTVQLHQEKTETPEAIEQGFPIMGICLGASCELAYSSEAGASKPKVLRLRSGDLFLLGGEARLLWHGFQRIIPNSSPSNLRLQPGMLHLSLRVH